MNVSIWKHVWMSESLYISIISMDSHDTGLHSLLYCTTKVRLDPLDGTSYKYLIKLKLMMFQAFLLEKHEKHVNVQKHVFTDGDE